MFCEMLKLFRIILKKKKSENTKNVSWKNNIASLNAKNVLWNTKSIS